MMKGDATCNAPSAAAPLMSVRRLNVATKVGDLISHAPGDYLALLVGVAIAWRRYAPGNRCQAGHCILQPVASTGPAAFSPGTGLRTLNILSGSPCGGCASPTNTVLISSWSPARYSGAPGCNAISGGSLNPDSARASLGASSVFS